MVARPGPEGQGVGGGLVLAAPLHLAQLAHQAGTLLGQAEQVQTEAVRGVEDGLHAAHQVVEVGQHGDVLPPVAPAQEAGAGGEEPEAPDCPPALGILSVHPHGDLQ